MENCPHCDRKAALYIPIAMRQAKSNEDYPYCSRSCFDADIDEALKQDLTHCRIYERVVALRDDAQSRVNNLQKLGLNKLVKTREYFQARADVLNDLLVVMDPASPCSCC